MIRRPSFLPESEWDEAFTVLEVRDRYKRKNGNGELILEFLTNDQQFRNVAITDIELNAGTIRRLQRMGISYR